MLDCRDHTNDGGNCSSDRDKQRCHRVFESANADTLAFDLFIPQPVADDLAAIFATCLKTAAQAKVRTDGRLARRPSNVYSLLCLLCRSRRRVNLGGGIFLHSRHHMRIPVQGHPRFAVPFLPRRRPHSFARISAQRRSRVYMETIIWLAVLAGVVVVLVLAAPHHHRLIENRPRPEGNWD